MNASRIAPTGLCLLLSIALGTCRVAGETSMALSADTAVDTRAIDLTAPTGGSINGSPMSVTFLLPRPALSNTVKLGFTGSVTRELTLSVAYETAGTHNLTFDPGNPTGTGAIASGEIIPDGVYTLTAYYQDDAGDPPVSNASTNVIIDLTPPVLVAPSDISVQANGDAGATVSYPSATASDPSTITSLTYSKASGSLFPIGVTTVTVTAKDGADNTAVATFTITVNGVHISVEQPVGTDLKDAAPVPVDFGTVVAGSSKNLTFLIRNPGTLDLTGLAVTKALNGTPGDFAIDTAVAATLAPNSATPVTVTFSPAAEGARSATLLIASNDPDENPFEIHLSGRQATALEAWRVAYFEHPDDTGPGANLHDGDADGIVNLLEFATASDPTVSTPSPGQLIHNGDNLEFTYTRPLAATRELTYSVETSTTLTDPWIPADPAASNVVSDDGVLQQVKVTVPAGSQARFFLRLRVTQP